MVLYLWGDATGSLSPEAKIKINPGNKSRAIIESETVSPNPTANYWLSFGVTDLIKDSSCRTRKSDGVGFSYYLRPIAWTGSETYTGIEGPPTDPPSGSQIVFEWVPNKKTTEIYTRVISGSVLLGCSLHCLPFNFDASQIVHSLHIRITTGIIQFNLNGYRLKEYSIPSPWIGGSTFESIQAQSYIINSSSVFELQQSDGTSQLGDGAVSITDNLINLAGWVIDGTGGTGISYVSGTKPLIGC